MRPPVIDADGHVDEQGVDWVARMPARLRELAPQLVPGKDPFRSFYVEGKQWPPESWFGKHGRGPVERKPPHIWTNRPGMKEPRARLADMDEEGIDQAVIFGTWIGLGAMSVVRDLDLGIAMSRAYNDWLTEYCQADPRRLRGMAIVPIQSAEAAAEELRRAVQENGMVGVVIPPTLQGVPLHDPRHFPLYAEAERLGVPVCVHLLSTHSVVTERWDSFGLKMAFWALDVMMAAGAVVTGGILDRFPGLRFGFMEAGAGWIPYLADRLHEYHELLPDHMAPLRREPMEAFRSDQMYFSFEPDEIGLPWAVEVIGEDRFLYASDYCHFDCMCPESVKAVAGRSDLAESTKRKVLHDNAARFFRLEA